LKNCSGMKRGLTLPSWIVIRPSVQSCLLVSCAWIHSLMTRAFSAPRRELHRVWRREERGFGSSGCRDLLRGSEPVAQLFDHPYAEFLEHVEKPTRYTGAEHGVRRKDWNSVDCRVCLAFPDLYDIGMSHLGYRMLYKILNDNPRLLAERCYTPWTDMM